MFRGNPDNPWADKRSLKNLNTLATAKNFLFLAERETYARQQVKKVHIPAQSLHPIPGKVYTLFRDKVYTPFRMKVDR